VSDAPPTNDDRPGFAAQSDGGVGQSVPKKSRLPQSKFGRWAVEWGIVIVGALLVVVVIRTFLFQAFYIPSPSMYPTLKVGDRVLVNKLSYEAHGVHRGDLVVFDRPTCKGKERPTWATCTEGGEIKDLIKRVIALPGDTYELRDGAVYINGQKLHEPYVAKEATGVQKQSLPICLFPTASFKYVIPDGDVFVMGDNRTNSTDSRCFGPIPKSSIVGRAFIRVWPVSRIAFL